MNQKRAKTHPKASDAGGLKVSFGDIDWQSPACKTIRSFFATPADGADFADFVQAILGEYILLAEIVKRESLHEDILRYHFEQVGFLGSSVDVLNSRVVLLRIHGKLFAVRQTNAKLKGEVAPLVEISGVAKGLLLQVIDCETFLQLWSQTTGHAPEIYDTNSSIQPYLQGLIKDEPLDLHNRSLKVESILGQGLEGTVFKVRDAQTQQPFALKVTYKDLRELHNYWSAGLAQLGKDRPKILSCICAFDSCEPAGKSGTTLLMEYIPLVSMKSMAPECRLANGLRVLADVINSIDALHAVGVCHGDLGVSNVYIRRHADGCDRAILIDPHPDVCSDFVAHQRKDWFGIAHILYWIVTGKQWPGGTYPYMLKVMTNDHDPAEGKTIFSDKPLDTQDEDSISLCAAAVRCVCDPDTFAAMAEAVKLLSDRLNHSSIATPVQLSDGAVVTSKDAERKVARALKSIGSGVFMPLFSLPSYFGRKTSKQREYGMGDSGPAAREFLQILRSTGQKFWMLLPTGPTDPGNCPYRADSSFAISINTISPEDLLADKWITQKELASTLPVFENNNRVPLSNDRIFIYKRELLAFAFKRRVQKSKADWQRAYESFIREEADWLDAYALYKTIEAQYPVRWTGWPDMLRDAEPAALEQFARANAEVIEQEKFGQFLAQHYFLKLRRFAEEQGIYMIGDMPAYSMHGSADVWAYRSAFELADNGERTRVAGAPPDVFDANGQGWNHPMYRWSEPATLRFLKRKYLRMKQLFANGFVRDDHIIGKVTPWGYTFGQPPAQGHRVTGAFLGNPLFDALLEAMPDLNDFLIGEDLGIVTPETRQLMQDYGFMGMKVLQFMPFNDGPAAIAENMYTPGNYSAANVMLLGTHDAPIIREWWHNALNDDGRYHFSQYLQQHLQTSHLIMDETVAACFTEFAMQQSPQMMLHQMPDIIVNRDGSVGLVGARMNDPSNHEAPEKNWSWRLPPDAFGEQTRAELKRLTEAAHRTPERAILRLARCWSADAVVTLAADVLRKTGKAGKALAQQLDSIVSKGRVRHASLGADCRSIVYRHLDGELYLLLSKDCPALEEQAVSLIRGVGVYMQQVQSSGQDSLKDIDDGTLLEYAQAAIHETEQLLRRFVLLSTDTLQEEMITFIGALLDASAADNAAVQKRLRAIEFSADESRELADRLQSVWTNLWVTYEQRGMSRRNIVEGILTGQLHGSRVSLRALNWRLVRAYSKELAATKKTLQQWEASITSWVKSLDVDAVKTCLFGISAPAFSHDLDVHGQAEGLSDLLGLMSKARRKEQNLEGYYKWFREYALELVHAVGSDESCKIEEMLRFTGSSRASGTADALRKSEHSDARAVPEAHALPERSFERLLEIIEQCLIVRLGTLKPLPDAITPQFPAKLDLQLHSYHSDCGGQSVARIVFEAYNRGLTTIALTDHQCFDGIEQALEIGAMLGVQVIPAIELYTGVRRGERVEQRRDILVYFPDVPRFLNWRKQGLNAESWQLFNDGWNRKVDSSQWGEVHIQRVTNWARAHGGVSVLAHPGLWSSEQFHQENWAFGAFERLFLETGLDGIEISHSRLPFEENTKRFVPLVEKFDQTHADRPIVFTMGTDSHTPEGIGRANLTKEAVTFIAKTFAPKGSAAQALHYEIVDRLRSALNKKEGNRTTTKE